MVRLPSAVFATVTGSGEKGNAFQAEISGSMVATLYFLLSGSKLALSNYLF
jgi:hypothetical protein